MFLRAPLFRLSRGLFLCATIALTANTYAQQENASQENLPEEEALDGDEALESVRTFFLTNPSGALIDPMLRRTADLQATLESFGRFRSIFLPAISAIHAKANQKIADDLAAARRKIRHNSTKTLEDRALILEGKLQLAQKFQSILGNWQVVADALYDKEAFQELIDQAKSLIETGISHDLKPSWMEASRLAGFSNSMSEHPAGHGIDLSAAVKIVPRGPSFLHGQYRERHGAHTRPVMEMDRHHGSSNPDVKMANWGNIISKALQVPLHRGYEPFMQGNYTGALAEVAAHPEEIGAMKLYEDARNEAIEASRGFFWVFYLLGEGESTLAYDAFVKAIGDMNAASRRLRKLIQLVPDGSFYLYTFQNLVSLPLFVLDFKEGYLETIQAMWVSLNKQQPGSSSYYAQMLALTNKVFEPALGSLYLMVYGFGTKPRAGWAMGHAHHTYNIVQYLTYALPQLLNHYKGFVDTALDKVGLSHDSSYRLPVTAASMLGGHFALVALYAGKMGVGPQRAVRLYAPYAVKVLLIDALSSNVLTTALGRPVNLLTSIPATSVVAVLAGARALAANAHHTGHGHGHHSDATQTHGSATASASTHAAAVPAVRRMSVMRVLPLMVGALAFDFRGALTSLWSDGSSAAEDADEL